MTFRLNGLRAALLAGAASLAFAPHAQAAAKNGDTKLDALQQQVQQLNAEIQELKQQRADDEARKAEEPDAQAAIADLKRSTSAQYADIQAQRANDVQISLKNGRPTFATGDGNFSVSLRTLVQYDTAYYGQSTVPVANTDFSSGNNFRRARFGAGGTLFKDWSYEFIYDFGGSGVEGSTISSAFIQYDGFGPVHIKLGAYAPPEGFEDQTSASDLLFLERAQPTDVARSIGSADGRDAATIFLAPLAASQATVSKPKPPVPPTTRCTPSPGVNVVSAGALATGRDGGRTTILPTWPALCISRKAFEISAARKAR